MSLPPLYVEGLTQHALRGHSALVAYKLGLIEALLKETLRQLDAGDEAGDEADDAVRSNLRAALDVALWDPPRSKPSS